MKRICAFYSTGHHFSVMLSALRKAYPDHRIVVMAPPGFARTPDVEALAEEIVETELTDYTLRRIGPCLRLLARIRADKFDVFAVMFDSPALCLLASLSGAPKRLLGSDGGRLEPLSQSAPGVVFALLGRAILGRLVYTGVWLAAHILPVRNARKRKE